MAITMKLIKQVVSTISILSPWIHRSRKILICVYIIFDENKIIRWFEKALDSISLHRQQFGGETKWNNIWGVHLCISLLIGPKWPNPDAIEFISTCFQQQYGRLQLQSSTLFAVEHFDSSIKSDRSKPNDNGFNEMKDSRLNIFVKFMWIDGHAAINSNSYNFNIISFEKFDQSQSKPIQE